MRNGRITLFVVAATALVLAALSSPAPAASGTWIGTAAGDWSTPGNWSGSTIADGATFTADLSTVDQTGGITVTIDGAVASRTLGILTVGDTNNTNSYTIAGSGGGTLTFSNHAASGQLNQIATSAGDTLDSTLPILLAGGLDISNASGNPLAVNGTVTPSYGRATIVKNVGAGTGMVTLGGVISDGPGRVYVTQTSTNSVLALSGTNAYTGWTEITAGAVRAVPGVGLPDASWLKFNSATVANGGVLEASGTFTRNIGYLPGNVYWQNHGGFAASGGDLTVTLNGGGTIDWNNNPQGFSGKTLILGSPTATNKVTVTNNIDMKNNRTIHVNDNTDSEADVAELSGVIADGDASARQLTKTGTGVLILSGDNTYSGQTNVNAGFLRVSGSNSSAANTIVGNGTLQLAGGTLASGNLQFNSTASIEAYGAPRSVDNPLVWNGNFKFVGSQNLHFTSTTTVTTGGRTITVGNTGVTTLSTPLAVNGNNTFNFSDGSGNVVLAGDATITGGNRTWTVNATGTAGILVVSGDVLEDAALRQLIKGGSGTMSITGDSSYTGLTVISGGALRAVDGNGLPATSTLQLNNGVLESKGTFVRSIGNAATGNLVYWNNTGGFAAAGGALTVNLGGAGATINWGANAASGFNSKTLRFGSITADNVVTLQNSIELRGDRTVEVIDNPDSAADYAEISGAIVNGDTTARQLTKTGNGTLVLSGTNTYTGNTNANAGTLKVTGSINNSTVVVNNAGTVLSGNGSVKALTVNANATVAPGDGIGTLAVVAGNCSLAATAIYEWELGSTSADLVNVTGNVTLTDGWVLKLIDAGGTVDVGTEYDLFTCTGTISLGTYIIDKSAVDWDTSGASILSAAGRVYVTGLAEPAGLAAPAVPEPCTAMLLVFGAAALLRRRRVADAA